MSNIATLYMKYFYFFLIAFTCLSVTPFTSYDPFNISKFVVLTIFSVGLLGLVSTKTNIANLLKNYKFESLFSIAFIINSLLILFFSPTPMLIQLFGADGRNTGFIFYVCTTILFVCTLMICNKPNSKYLVITLIFVGLLNALYGLVQFLDLDPFNWTNPYNPVFGFFGNPNFQSAFMGIVSATLWSLLLSKQMSKSVRIMIISFLVLTLFIIVVSDSIQGLILYVAGLFIAILFYITSKHELRKLLPHSLILFGLVSVIAVLDILQRTPWKSILYKESLSNRGDLWRSAWKMGLDNPLLGVGFDGFGYFYRQYRDSVSILERGETITSSSAHNVFLDAFTSGGFPLLLSYVLLLLLVVKASLNGLIKSKSYDPIFTSLVAGWICYQIQSLISINQIGIAIWGWILGGSIIAYEKTVDNDTQRNHTYYVAIKKKNFIFHLLGLLIGSIISLPGYLADSNFRKAIDSRQIDLVLNAAYKWPQSPQRMYQVSSVFKQNEVLDLSKQVSSDAVELFPRSYENWEILSVLSNTSDNEKTIAKQFMEELDPNNPNIR